jgi:hypothetical protein
MKKQLVKSNSFLIMVVVALVLTFALSLSAQKGNNKGNVKQPAVDTSILPHDFIDKFYMLNGVSANYIMGRRTGYDFLSVIDWSSNPYHTDVRILATLPAYGANGEILFFSPLGEINDSGFTEDQIGKEARAIADTYPIYVFPANNSDSFAFGTSRQAALMDAEAFNWNMDGYPVGLRSIMLVNYTPKAFTEEGFEMMDFMFKKNGKSLDGTPLIRSMEDLTTLAKFDLVSMEKRVLWDDTNFAGTYSLSPIIYQPVKGVIAPDAFLITVTQKGEPLPDEMRFVSEFNCLRKGGNWCSEL